MFDFTAFFQQLGRKIVIELQQRMYRQTGVDDLRYSTLSPATVRQKIKTSSATARLRMIRTKDFVNRAFKYVAGKDFVKVFISNALHGRDLATARKKQTRKKLATSRAEAGQSFANIAKWQIDTGAAKFFPTNSLEIQNLDAVEQAEKSFKYEVLRQIKEKGLIKAKQVLG